MQDIILLQQQAAKAISEASNFTALEAIRIDYLGKKGQLTELLKGLSALSPADRPKVGQLVNEAKRQISSLIEEKILQLKEEQLQAKLSAECLDVSLPGRNYKVGSLHPVSQVK